jgi:hypothetical protein
MRARDRWALGLLALATPRRDRDALVGDLLEEHAERGGLARECVRAVLPVLALRLHRAGGLRALGFAWLAGGLAAAVPVLVLGALWQFVLFHVPLRAAGSEPLVWRLAGVVPALVAGVCTGRLAFRLAIQLLGGRA